MKYAITAIIFLAVMLGIFLLRSCGKETITQTLVDALKADKVVQQAQINKLEKEKAILFDIIDSLKTIPPKIDQQIVTAQDEVNEAISKDSLNAITEYRKGLNLLDIRTESTPTLTLREIGLGAYTFRETHGLRLKVTAFSEIIDEQDNYIDKQEKLIEAKNNIIKTDESIISGLELLVKEAEPDFWQKYSMIAIYIILAFVGGLAVAL